jgi:hypothetical protein
MASADKLNEEKENVPTYVFVFCFILMPEGFTKEQP